MSLKFLPCLHIAICCIENHLTTSDWVMLSFSYMAFILVHLRGLLYSYILTIMSQEEIAPEGSKLRVIINILILKILKSIYSIEFFILPKLKKPQPWVSHKAEQ